MTKQCYFNLLECYRQPPINDIQEAISSLDSILHTSVKDRLMSSDLEVGAFLSGGIDSALIVAIASEYQEKIKTFTVKFEGAFDESALAKLTAKQYKTDHHELRIDMNLKEEIETILYQYGEPFMDSSAIPSYYVSREAKKWVNVILNGDGADELFGGYRRYVPIANGWIKWASYLSFLTKILPKAHTKHSYYTYIYRLLSMANKSGLSQYISATNDSFEEIYTFESNPIFQDIQQFIYDVQSQPLSELSKMLYLDFHLILGSDLLKKMDIATMSHSLEGRSPFLSRDIMTFAPRLADRLKIQGTTTKFLLRQLSQSYLPSVITQQPKRGFEVPLKKWIEEDLKENIFDALCTNSFSERFLERSFIHDLLNKRLNVSDEKRAKMLWTLYCMEVWYAKL